MGRKAKNESNNAMESAKLKWRGDREEGQGEEDIWTKATRGAEEELGEERNEESREQGGDIKAEMTEGGKVTIEGTATGPRDREEGRSLSTGGAFVLCQLFNKPEEKTAFLKYDEGDPIGLSPATTRSSPQDTSSELLVVESCCNIHLASDKEDHMTEAASTVWSLPVGNDSVILKHPDDQVDCRYSPHFIQMPTEMAHYIDSLFASEFGNDQLGFYFQDGTREQDVCFLELMDEVFNNHGISASKESTSKETDIGQLPRAPHGYSSQNYGSCSTTVIKRIPAEPYVFDEAVGESADLV
ncbi:hypothetical protein Nepgr_031724 [Nepenthes gracilis]|uniref:Uncharacterized protein n=1 Tax=Nepenthes gracilis TaxID=150966 RepID=A0AAD3Y7R6_NEPGR|nr:hypothetical protein Nepgr_031724 [Nepenthes gracilis]